MIIVREGKEFALTHDEIYQAYLEQEFLFDVDDVRSELECIAEDVLSDSEAAIAAIILKDDNLLEQVAECKRRNMDKYNMSWDFAVHDAVHDAIQKLIEESEKNGGHLHT